MGRIFTASSLLLSVAALLAGCMSPAHTASPGTTAPATLPSFDGLQASNPKATTVADGVVQYAWDGTTGAGVSAILVTERPQDPLLQETFQVDSRVGYVEANISLDPSLGSIVALVTDDHGHLQCGAVNFLPHTSCTVPVPANDTAKATWKLTVQTAYETQPHLPTGALQPPVGRCGCVSYAVWTV